MTVGRPCQWLEFVLTTFANALTFSEVEETIFKLAKEPMVCERCIGKSCEGYRQDDGAGDKRTMHRITIIRMQHRRTISRTH